MQRQSLSDVPDVLDPAVRRERFFSQDRRILDAVSMLATKVKACPVDPRYAGHEPALYIVGGFARDVLIGKRPKDADVEVYGVSAKRLEELLRELYGDRVNSVGESFEVLKVGLGDGLDLDISIPRRESKIAPGHKGFEVQGDPTMSLKEAMRRRDFTINSLAVDPLTGDYEDQYGGLEDLCANILRVTDEERFQDDPLRVYRAIQFVARMHLHVEDRTFALMHEMVERGDLTQLSAERITEEWRKMFLKSDRPSIGFELVDRLGIVATYHPEFGAAETIKALERAVDLAAHVIHADSYTLSENEQLLVMLGAMGLHMPQGEKGIRTFLAKMSFSKKEIVELIGPLMQECKEPSRIWKAWKTQVLNEAQVANEIRKVVKRIHPATPETLRAIYEAEVCQPEDVEAEDRETDPAAVLFETHLLLHPEWRDPKKNQLINGEELLGLGVPAGPEMGEAMNKIEEARDQGVIETHKEALEWLAEERKK